MKAGKFIDFNHPNVLIRILIIKNHKIEIDKAKFIICNEWKRLRDQSRNLKKNKITQDIYEEDLARMHVLHPEDDTVDINGI